MNFIRSGFRAVRDNPTLIFAEIAWRWAFGAVASMTIVIAVRTILEGIDVSSAEIAMARTSDAYLIADAIARVLVQVLPRLAQALLVIVPLLAIVWTVAATAGRLATVRALLNLRSVGFQAPVPPRSGRPLASLAALNALRALFAVATSLAFFGTVFLVSSQFTPSLSPNVGPALIFGWMCLAVLVAVFWGLVNWFLALAPIFIFRDGLGAWKALAASVSFYRDHRRDYTAIASMFGIVRGAALIVAVVAGLTTVAAGSVVAALVLSIVIALIYFAVADFLYIARLAAYVELATAPSSTTIPAAVPITGPSSAPPNLELET